MPTCSRNGCKKEYSEDDNGDTACKYHPGGPVFHEGLKSWSCCSDVNKPELDFDVFMNIPGCKTGSHTAKVEVKVKEKPVEKPKTADIQVEKTANGVEVYTQSGPQKPPITGATASAAPSPAPPPPPPVEEEEDDLGIPVQKGTICKRKGCGKEFVSDEENRIGDGEGTRCAYHPSAPIFHEGSKGYMCCKRRVLEFDEFLKIEGCKVGRHLFAPKQKKQAETEQVTMCRIDHYQTPMDVHVSVFAKQVDQDRSSVLFEDEMVHLDLYLPQSKRFKKTLNLYGPIDPKLSKYRVLSTKVEITLSKGDSRSWNLLEKSDRDVGQFKLTFGVGGRTGTVGSREAVFDSNNQITK